jgi:hypothetical protein
MIFFGESSLLRAIQEYVEHDHFERPLPLAESVPRRRQKEVDDALLPKASCMEDGGRPSEHGLQNQCVGVPANDRVGLDDVQGLAPGVE